MTALSNEFRRTRTPDGGILLDIERGRMFSLNLVGFEIVELFDRGCDEAQIVDQISAAYGVDIDSVRADVRTFLKVLDQKHILPRSSQP